MLKTLRVYTQPRMLAVLFMGFSSGLPYALTTSTLSVWLAESHVSLTSIGFFSLAGLAYNLKFIWAPVLDHTPLPLLTKLLGRRRSWAVTTQICLFAAILALGSSDPTAETWRIACLAVLVAFFSATQDIVIDAYRVELLNITEQGAGAAATQTGYRLAIIVSGAGALYAASAFGWQGAYAVMAVLMLVGVVTVLLTPEPELHIAPPRSRDWLSETLIAPFRDLALRRGWVLLLVFIVVYKLGDAMAANLASPFYISLGFTKNEIASVTKAFGLLASILGVFLGGLAVYRLGIMRALLACGLLQMVSNLLYIAQSLIGHDVAALTLTIGIEHIATGMGSAAFVAFLSSLCSPAHTATQYALLSALALAPRNILSAPGGWIAQEFGWVPFFGFSVALALPGLLLVLWLMRRPVADHPSVAAAE